MTDIKRYVFKYIDSNMYVMVENGEALVVDPHIDSDADRYLKANGVKRVTILLTHEHFDHTCGIPWFREHYQVTVICQQEALNPKLQKLTGRPITISLILSDQGRDDDIAELEAEYPAFTFTAEQTFDESFEMKWYGHKLLMKHTPGHSPASCLIFLDDDIVFTGDSLVPGCEPTLRWPGSDGKTYLEVTVPCLLNLSKESMIYPGHREVVFMNQLKYVDGNWEIKAGSTMDEIINSLINNIYVDEEYLQYRSQLEKHTCTAKNDLEGECKKQRKDFSISWDQLAIVFAYDYNTVCSKLSKNHRDSNANGRFIPISQLVTISNDNRDKNFAVINCKKIFSDLGIKDSDLKKMISDFVLMSPFVGCIIHELNHFLDYQFFYEALDAAQSKDKCYMTWMYSELRSKYYQEYHYIKYGFKHTGTDEDFRNDMCKYVEDTYNKLDKRLCDAEDKEYTTMHQIGQLACWLDKGNYIGITREKEDWYSLSKEIKKRIINLQNSEYCVIPFLRTTSNVTEKLFQKYDEEMFNLIRS